jgi:V/A-type H+-transporting ATPase subunit C
LTNAKYAFMSAYLKGAEAKTVTSEHIDRMSKTPSLQDVLETVKDTDIGGYLEEAVVKTFDDADKYLWEYFGECLERLKGLKLAPADILKVLEAYIVKYDVLNIKAALQGISIGKKASLIPVGVVHGHGLLDELSRAEDVDAIKKVLVECKLGAYASALDGYTEGAKSKFLVEARLDLGYYVNLLNIAKSIQDGSLLARAFSIMIDMANLQLINRAIIEGIGSEADELVIGGGYLVSDKVAKDLLSHKLADIPGALAGTQYRNIAEEVVASYNRTKSITAVEEVIDKHKFRLLREMLSPRVLTPLVIAWYLIVKEIEIRNLRLVLKATFDNIPVEEIKDYLVFAS